jgi:hypothetical protein
MLSVGTANASIDQTDYEKLSFPAVQTGRRMTGAIMQRRKTECVSAGLNRSRRKTAIRPENFLHKSLTRR